LLDTSSRLVAVVGPMNVSPLARVATNTMQRIMATLGFIFKKFSSFVLSKLRGLNATDQS
jgi:hypothetical protein